MRVLMAIFLPFLVFINLRKPVNALICFFMQISMIGWAPASMWALYASIGGKDMARFKKGIILPARH